MKVDVLSMGEALVDFLPRERGRLRQVRGFEVMPGGAPANVAVGAARLGASVAYVGVVGEDEFGHFLRDALEAEGIDCSGLRHLRGPKTGLSFIALDERGERSFDFYGKPSADMHLEPEDVREEQVAAARIVHFGSNSLLLEQGVAAVRRLVALGRASGALVSCDPNLRLHLWDDVKVLRRLLDELTAASDVVKCAAEETETICGSADPREAARILVGRGAKLAVVTLGADGAVWARAADEGEAQAPKVEAVDATGAGDGFMAGLLVRLAAELRAGIGPEDIPADRLGDHVRFACRIGAAVVSKLGAVAGLPHAGEPLPGE